MLQFVLGRSGFGKTEYVFSSIKRLVDSGEDNILLITPEQFSFIAERRLLTDLGESNISRVENASFSRLASEAARLYGGDELPTLSKGGKAVMMKRAVEMVQDELVLFSRHASSPSFVNSAVQIYDEMKACRVSNDDIISAQNNAESETLRQKLGDISKIIMAYDAIIDGRYYDSADALTRLYHKLLDKDYFVGRTVFIDGFYGFVAQEYKIIEVILKQAKEVYVTFCSDTFYNSDKFDLFSYINRNVVILRDVARKIGVKIANPIMLDKNYRCQTRALSDAEKCVFTNKKSDARCEGEIRLYSSRNISDECDRVAFEISHLLRSGCKARSIAVVTRDLQRYKKELEFSFDKFRVPYFNDERQLVSSQPIILFVGFLLRIAIYNFQSSDIFSLLKTGLTSLDGDEISALENYAYIWSINGSAWKKEFVNSTKGFVEKISDNDRKALDDINNSRQYVIEKITKFIRSASGKAPMEICRAIYFALIDFSCDKRLKELAIELDKNGKSSLAKEQGRVWDLLMQTLDTLAMLGESEAVSLDEFYKLFNLMIANEDLGTLPSGLDNVQIGSADRMRFDNPDYVFVVGANEGEFPQTVSTAGLLSESDRAALIENDFKLYAYGETLNAQERFFAYMALSSARRGLFVSYCGAQGSSESSVVTSLKSVFPDLKTEFYKRVNSIDGVESIDSAFEILASDYNENNVFISSLKSYFAAKPEYSSRLSAVDTLVKNVNPRIESSETATKLFGYDMYLSASKIEDYYNCAFKHFCKFGIGARPRIKAEMNPMQTGTVIHYVLEQVLKNYTKEKFVSLSMGELRLLVNKYLTEYIEGKMGDSTEFTSRFKYQFMRLSKMLAFVVEHLRQELMQSDFVPSAFELTIGDGSNGEEIKSISIPVGDGSSIMIKGAVDRVDTFVKNGRRYVRVVDYKSGSKEFSLCDILNGINLQMFIYLFNICSTENDYKGIGAGVLYMHASRGVVSVSPKGYSEAGSKAQKDFKMKGIVLNDEENSIAENMEYDLKGVYIPVKSGKQGISGDIASLEELGRISQKIMSLVANMGLNLHSGLIAQNPISGAKYDKTCEFCEYSAVCMNRTEIEVRQAAELSSAEVMELLKEEFGDNVD